jgi:hypothetical protein
MHYAQMAMMEVTTLSHPQYFWGIKIIKSVLSLQYFHHHLVMKPKDKARDANGYM